MMEWRNKIQKECDEAGIESLGKIPQAEAAKLYQEGSILAYPTEFYEIDCISVKKAQLAGCIPITTDFAALAESNKFGLKVKSKKTKDNWCKPYQISFGIEDEEAQQMWVDTVVKLLGKSSMASLPEEMVHWAKTFEWSRISKSWMEIFASK